MNADGFSVRSAHYKASSYGCRWAVKPIMLLSKMEENIFDKRARLYRAISGLIPGGSFLIEYMIDRIPDQRMERLFKFISEMNQRIEALENQQVFQTEEFGFLAENAILESSRAQSQKRLKWLASITIPTSSFPPEIEWDYRKRAVSILSELTDTDVECLLHHVSFEEKFKFERDHNQQYFISYAENMNLPDYELFLKNLKNQHLDLHRYSLIKQGLIRVEDNDRSSNYTITEQGRLFVYLISEMYPRE